MLGHVGTKVNKTLCPPPEAQGQSGSEYGQSAPVYLPPPCECSCGSYWRHSGMLDQVAGLLRKTRRRGRFNPRSPDWDLDSHVAGPPACPSARTIWCLPARLIGHLQFQGREELWEALPFFSELGESSFPCLAPHPMGLGGTVAFTFS